MLVNVSRVVKVVEELVGSTEILDAVIPAFAARALLVFGPLLKLREYRVGVA